VVNSGDMAGDYTARLMVNGILEHEQTGTVGGHAVVPVQFIVSRSEPGEYIVDINGQQSRFNVEGETGMPNMNNDIPVLGAVLCLTGIVAIIVLLLMRRREAC
jgi:hypothetical protein